MSNAVVDSALSDAQAMTTLLGVEGFLLAAVALSINLSAAGQAKPRRFNVQFERITLGAAIVLTLVAVGAISAWYGIYGTGRFMGFPEAIAPAALAIGIVAQPVIALLLAYGSKHN